MKQKKDSHIIFSTLLILIIILSSACNNSTENSRKTKSTNLDLPDKSLQITNSGDDNIIKRGEDIYKKVCLTCHQANGSGVPMMFPPITESEIINGDHEKLIKLILEGMSGPVEIKGEQYNSIMPPQKDLLDDKQISELLTYLRSSFGNSGDAITPEEVAQVRN